MKIKKILCSDDTTAEILADCQTMEDIVSTIKSYVGHVVIRDARNKPYVLDLDLIKLELVDPDTIDYLISKKMIKESEADL